MDPLADSSRSPPQPPATSLRIGDRIIYTPPPSSSGKDSAKKHSNNTTTKRKHGVVSAVKNGQVKVQWDLWNPTEPSESWIPLTPESATAEPSLEREIVYKSYLRTAGIAPFSKGRLKGVHEEAYQFLLKQVRYVVSTFLLGDKKVSPTEEDLDSLPKRCQLTPLAWRQWETSGSKVGVHAVLKRYLTERVLYSNHHGLSRDGYKIVWDALENSTCLQWTTRVHGLFWVVGVAADGSGAYLVPDSNHSICYKALSGDPTQLHVKLARSTYRRPIQVQLTLLNWYGRLVTDGVISTGRRPGPPRTVRTADDELAARLQQAVFSALNENRMISKLNQLEILNQNRRRRCPRTMSMPLHQQQQQLLMQQQQQSSPHHYHHHHHQQRFSSRSLPTPSPSARKQHLSPVSPSQSIGTVTTEALSLDVSRHSKSPISPTTPTFDTSRYTVRPMSLQEPEQQPQQQTGPEGSHRTSTTSPIERRSSSTRRSRSSRSPSKTRTCRSRSVSKSKNKRKNNRHASASPSTHPSTRASTSPTAIGRGRLRRSSSSRRSSSTPGDFVPGGQQPKRRASASPSFSVPGTSRRASASPSATVSSKRTSTKSRRSRCSMSPSILRSSRSPNAMTNGLEAYNTSKNNEGDSKRKKNKRKSKKKSKVSSKRENSKVRGRSKSRREAEHASVHEDYGREGQENYLVYPAKRSSSRQRRRKPEPRRRSRRRKSRDDTNEAVSDDSSQYQSYNTDDSSSDEGSNSVDSEELLNYASGDDGTLITFTDSTTKYTMDEREPPLILRDAVVYDEEEMASLVSVHGSQRDETPGQLSSDDQVKERILLEYLMDCEPSEDSGSFWVFQRVPDEVQQHLLRGSKLPPMAILCGAPGPNSIDVLKALYFATKQGVRRPHTLFVDDERCCERLQYLVRDMDDFRVEICKFD